METRTLEIVLQRSDRSLVAQLTVPYPPPTAVSYGGQQWHRTSGLGLGEPIVYQPDRAFVRPATQEEPMPRLGIVRSRRRR